MHYRIFFWSSQLIQWPLLRPLHFVINDRNKCTTSSLGKWWSSSSDDHKFLTHQASFSMIVSLELVPSPLSSIATFVMASSMTTLMDSITVFILLLKTLYARLVVEYPRKIPSSLGSISLLAFSYSKFHIGLLCSRSEEYSIANVTWGVHGFSPKLLRYWLV